VRRPAKTAAQTQHDRQQRALLRLRRAAVRFTLSGSSAAQDPFAFAELTAACDAYTETLSVRETRKLARTSVVKTDDDPILTPADIERGARP